MHFSGYIIGITPGRDEDNKNYRMRIKVADWIRSAGLCPLMYDMCSDENYIKKVCSISDGIIFSGGGDILPYFYGEHGTDNCNGIDRQMRLFELKLFAEARKRGLPILGICRGAQLIAVGLGGRLGRNITGHSESTHTIIAVENTEIYRITGGKAEVNSYHHQFITSLPTNGTGIISAADESGTAEAVEAPNGSFCVGVQWHPELEIHNEVSLRLIKRFSESVKNNQVFNKS